MTETHHQILPPTPPDRPQPEPPEPPLVVRRGSWIGIGLLGLAYLLATATLWTTPAWFLDDYVICSVAQDEGVLASAADQAARHGLYRAATGPVVAVVGSLCEGPRLQQFLGGVVHLAAAVLLFRILAVRVRLSAAAAGLAFVLLLFQPLQLEAVGWVTAAKVFPLGALLTAWFAWRALAPSDEGRRWVTALIGLAAVTTAEQTLPFVVLVPLLAPVGGIGRRVAVWWRCVWPSLFYVVALAISSRVSEHPRLSGPNRASPGNLIGNVDVAIEGVLPAFPAGSTFDAFAAGPYTAVVLAAIAIAAVGVLLLALAGPSERPSELGARAAVAFGLATATGSAAMVLLAAEPWISPRVMYLPYVGVAVAAAGVAGLGRRRAGPAVASLAALALLVWFTPGLARDAGAYVATYHTDVAETTALAEAIARREPDTVVLVEVPWLLDEIPPANLGEHIVKLTAVSWALPSGLGLLGVTIEEEQLVIDHYAAALCLGPDGAPLLEGGRFDPGSTLVFAVRQQVEARIVDVDGELRLEGVDGQPVRELLTCPA